MQHQQESAHSQFFLSNGAPHKQRARRITQTSEAFLSGTQVTTPSYFSNSDSAVRSSSSPQPHRRTHHQSKSDAHTHRCHTKIHRKSSRTIVHGPPPPIPKWIDILPPEHPTKSRPIARRPLDNPLPLGDLAMILSRNLDSAIEHGLYKSLVFKDDDGDSDGHSTTKS
jgi:hypothetical protein